MNTKHFSTLTPTISKVFSRLAKLLNCVPAARKHYAALLAPLILISGCVVYFIPGMVSGLNDGNSFTMLWNGVTFEKVSQNGPVNLPYLLSEGAKYSLEVTRQPSGQTCTPQNGTGIAGQHSEIQIICEDNPFGMFSVTAVVNNLNDTLNLLLNGAETLTVNQSGAYTFATLVEENTTYSLQVAFPFPATQFCWVDGSSGTITTDINIDVFCLDRPIGTFAIGGVIGGLTGPIDLQLNGGEILPITKDGPFYFNTFVGAGQPYSIGIVNGDPGCVIVNGSGIANDDVSSIIVDCSGALGSIGIGGNVGGLGDIGGAGSGLQLQLNNGEIIELYSDGPFNFNTLLTINQTYNIQIINNPDGKSCSITSGGSGTASTQISDIVITCVDVNPVNSYSIGGQVSGLAGTLELQLVNQEILQINSDGAYQFSPLLAENSQYTVLVYNSPVGQTCQVSNGSGTITANVSNVDVACAATPVPSYTIGGSVSGLTGTMTIKLNDIENLQITTNGSFEFSSELNEGESYIITMVTQPDGQTCNVTGSGTVGGPVTDISIVCSDNSPGGGGNGDGDGDGDGDIDWRAQYGTSASDYAKGGVVSEAGANPVIYITGKRYANHFWWKSWVGTVHRFDHNGNYVSSLEFAGSKRYSVVNNAVADDAGNIYVVGYTDGSLNGQINHGWYDAFVAKINAQDQVVWTRLIGSDAAETAYGIALIGNKLYIAGSTGGAFAGHSCRGDSDGYVTELDIQGNVGWTTYIGSDDVEYLESIAADSNGDLVVAGTSIDRSTHYHADSDVLAAKLDAQGNILWQQTYGDQGNDNGTRGIAVDSNNDIYITATSQSTPFREHPNHGQTDAVLIKADTEGNLVWTRVVGSHSHDTAWDVSVNSQNVISIVGNIKGQLPNRSPVGEQDVFVAKWLADGTAVSLAIYGSKKIDAGRTIMHDSDDNIYFGGHTLGDLGGADSAGHDDVYVIRLSP